MMSDMDGVGVSILAFSGIMEPRNNCAMNSILRMIPAHRQNKRRDAHAICRRQSPPHGRSANSTVVPRPTTEETVSSAS